MNKLSNIYTELNTPISTQKSIDDKFIKDAQGFYIQLSLLDIDNLPEHLQSLANARYCLSVIYDEFIKVGKTQRFNREKLINFTVNLWKELEKATYKLTNYDDNAKELSEQLNKMAENLFVRLYADEEIISHISFIDILIQTLEISRVIDLLCEILLSNKSKGA